MKKAVSVLFALALVLQLGFFSAQPGITAYAAAKVPVASVKVTPASISWAVGNTGAVKAVVSPANASVKSVSWKSSNPAVASVDSTGKVKALNVGSAIITCTAKDGSGKKAVVKATVKAPATIAEIVTLYNNAANATKAYKGVVKATKYSGTTTKINSMSPDMKVLKDKAKEMLPNDYEKKASITFKNGKDIKGKETLVRYLPRDGEAKMSVLQAAGVKSATCTKTGTGWKIVITLKAETVNSLNKKPKYHAQCMDTLNMSDDDLKPFKLTGSPTVTYTDKTTIISTVNAKGLLNNVHVAEPARIKGTLSWSFVDLIKLDVTGTWKQDITLTY